MQSSVGWQYNEYESESVLSTQAAQIQQGCSVRVPGFIPVDLVAGRLEVKTGHSWHSWHGTVGTLGTTQLTQLAQHSWHNTAGTAQLAQLAQRS